MKKLIFTLAALLMAGTAMADRVVTFNAETDELGWVAEDNSEGWTQNIYEMSKDGVTIRLTQSGLTEVQGDSYWYFPATETFTVISDLYEVFEDVPSDETFYGGISKIVIYCQNNPDDGIEMQDPQPAIYEWEESVSEDGKVFTYDFISSIGRMPELVDFLLYTHLVVYKIEVTLDRVDSTTPGDDPTIAPKKLTICDGMEICPTVPITGRRYADGTYSQMIYPAEMLTDMIGSEITQLKFYVDGTLQFSGGGIILFMGEVGQSSYDDDYINLNYETIYGMAVPEAGASELVFDLDQPYVYNGGNLVIELVRGGSDDDVISGETYFYGVEMDYYCSTSDSGDRSLEYYMFLPKVTFGYEEGGEPGPENPHATGYWLVTYTLDGEEVWDQFIPDKDNYTMILPLNYDIYGTFAYPIEPRPNISFRVVADGVDMGAVAPDTKAELGNALLNPTTEGDNLFYLEEGLGHIYNMGLFIDPNDGQIYVYAAIAGYTDVTELNADKAVAGVRYFNMAGQEMQEANGVTIVVTTYTDGTTSAVKVMK